LIETICPRNKKNATGRCYQLDGDVFLNMLRMALELSKTNEIYEDISVKFSNILSTLLGQCIIMERSIALGRSRQFYYDV
jgi:hypothetical protein